MTEKINKSTLIFLVVSISGIILIAALIIVLIGKGDTESESGPGSVSVVMDRDDFMRELNVSETFEFTPAAELPGSVSQFLGPFLEILDEQDADKRTAEFSVWKEENLEESVEWRLVSRGFQPIKDDNGTETGDLTYVFRPAEKRFRQIMRVRCTLSRDSEAAELMRRNTEVMITGKIEDMVSQVPEPGIEALPFGSLLTVKLHDVTIQPSLE
jgi:hypothetical protein